MSTAASASPNPLVRDRDVEFLLYEVLDVVALCKLRAFAAHGRETFDFYLQSTRRLAREALYPAYRPMDEEPAVLVNGKVTVHPRMKALYPQMAALGLLTATRPESVGGHSLPMSVATFANAYLMAANASAYGYFGLTCAAAHLLEAFGDDHLRRDVMPRMYEGEWTGTMALTEPHAGSSLADVGTRATPIDSNEYRIQGSKIFISGGDHDLADNIVHMTLARIDGAPAGIKGVSLFAIPKLRSSGDSLVANDVHVAGMIHKIGWRGLPSVILNFGEQNDCHGWLVGEANHGISYMFQMMNEARIMIGVNGVATASVAYHEALAYAETRTQGRDVRGKDPSKPQIPILAHDDVKRMLLRQKAIVEGGLALVSHAAYFADLSEHADDPDVKKRAALLLDLLTPIAKSFPAERGFEANALALQVHGGYGYSSEYLVEAWLRDQKLNSLHEGTTGIQGLDLLGRKAVGEGGKALALLRDAIAEDAASAERAGVDADLARAVVVAIDRAIDLTTHLARLAVGGDVPAMLRHSTDYLEMMSILVVSWQWLRMATAAMRGRADASDSDRAFYDGKLQAARYWWRTELPRAATLDALCRSGDDSYARMEPGWF